MGDWRSTLALEALKSYALKAIVGLVGWRAWLARLLINAIFSIAKFLSKYLEVNKEVQKQLDKYSEVINDPKSTADDIRNAAPDFLK